LAAVLKAYKSAGKMASAGKNAGRMLLTIFVNISKIFAIPRRGKIISSLVLISKKKPIKQGLVLFASPVPNK